MEKEKSPSLLQRMFPQTHAFVSKLKPVKKIKSDTFVSPDWKPADSGSIGWKKHSSGFWFDPPQPDSGGVYHALVHNSYPVVNEVPAGPFSGVEPDLGDAKEFYSKKLLQHFDRTPESFAATTGRPMTFKVTQ
jgi:hypothetical protein